MAAVKWHKIHLNPQPGRNQIALYILAIAAGYILQRIAEHAGETRTMLITLAIAGAVAAGLMAARAARNRRSKKDHKGDKE